MIRRMEAPDIPAAMRLKAAAGWNQTRADWERVLRLGPGACLVEDRDGEVIGTTSAVPVGLDLGWIGMVLVLPRFRRQGVARGLLGRALELVEHEGSAGRVWGLDATDMARPLYEESGFVTQESIERWERPPRPRPGVRAPGLNGIGADRKSAAGSLPERLASIDREAYGYNRTGLLADLWNDADVEAVRSDDAFAFGRRGSSAWFLGPCVGLDERGAGRAIRPLLAQHRHERIFWDLLPSNGAARSMALRSGFRPVRRLTRMLLHGDKARRCPAHPSLVFAMPGFEFG